MAKQFFIHEKSLLTLRDGSDDIVTIYTNSGAIKDHTSDHYYIQLDDSSALKIHNVTRVIDSKRETLQCSAKRLRESQITHEDFVLFKLANRIGEFIVSFSPNYKGPSVKGLAESVEFFKKDHQQRRATRPGIKITKYMPCLATYSKASLSDPTTAIGLQYDTEKDEIEIKEFNIMIGNPDREGVNLLLDLDDPIIKGDNVQTALEYLKLCLENN